VRSVAALLVALGLVVLPAAEALPGAGRVALGSCVGQPSLEEGLAQARVVFVGTVAFLENSNRWAIVNVEERWQGADELGASVEVRGAGDPGTSTTIDRSYEPRRYLFAVEKGAGYLVDNACSATTLWTDALARLRPDGVEAAPGLAVASPIDDVDMRVLLPVAGLVGALLVAIVAYVIVLRARRRPPDWHR
jgi:hypothetical protein